MTNNTDWQDRAACKAYHPFGSLGQALTGWQTMWAKDICKTCPVKAECSALADELEVATVSHTGYPVYEWQGVWGGEDPQERAVRRGTCTQDGSLPPRNSMTRRGPQGPTSHATKSMYNKGCTCFLCCEANRFSTQWTRLARKENISKQRIKLRHNDHPVKCKCEECRALRAEYERNRKRNKMLAARTVVVWTCRGCGHSGTHMSNRPGPPKVWCDEKCRKRAQRVAGSIERRKRAGDGDGTGPGRPAEISEEVPRQGLEGELRRGKAA